MSFRDAATDILALYRTALFNANTPAGVWQRLVVTNQLNPTIGAIIGAANNLVAPVGTTFVRQQMVYPQLANATGSVGFDDLNLFQSVGAVPPMIENLSPDGSTPLANPSGNLSFQASSPCAGIAASGVQAVQNGLDVSSPLVITGSATNRSVSFSGLAANIIYSAWVAVTDVNGLWRSSSGQFDTFSHANFMWEAEDFDYGSGQFINDPNPERHRQNQQLLWARRPTEY